MSKYTLFPCTYRLRDTMFAASDGEKVYIISRKDYREFAFSDLNDPIVANRLQFVLDLSYVLTDKEIMRKLTMAGSTSPCDVFCPKCASPYPTYGRLVRGDTEECEACGYRYTYYDI